MKKIVFLTLVVSLALMGLVVGSSVAANTGDQSTPTPPCTDGKNKYDDGTCTGCATGSVYFDCIGEYQAMDEPCECTTCNGFGEGGCFEFRAFRCVLGHWDRCPDKSGCWQLWWTYPFGNCGYRECGLAPGAPDCPSCGTCSTEETCVDGQCVPLISIPEPLPEQTSGVAYVTIRGSAPTSMFIAKIWDGNRWIDPKYMSPELIEPPGPWSVQYILGVSGTAKFGLFERGEENGQNPVWTTEVTVVPYENKVIVARNEELRFPESRP